jgi:hypothetical protein
MLDMQAPTIGKCRWVSYRGLPVLIYGRYTAAEHYHADADGRISPWIIAGPAKPHQPQGAAMLCG